MSITSTSSPTPTGPFNRPDTFARGLALWHRVLPFLAATVFALGIYFIQHMLKKHTYREIADSIQAIPRLRVWQAVGLTAGSYLLLGCYDLLGFLYIGQKLSRLKIIFASFTAFSFSNNIGLANLAGSSIRLRVYSTYGINPKDILKIIAFCSVTFWIGFFSLAGVMLNFFPLPFPSSFGISTAFVRAFGALLLALAVFYLSSCLFRRRPFEFLGHQFQLPSFRLAMAQVLVAAGDWALAGLVLYLLLPISGIISYPQFLSVFISAQVIALIAHVPGGIGVLEALVIYFVSRDHESNPAILGGLLAYRLIYYLFPLLIAAMSLLAYELSGFFRR